MKEKGKSRTERIREKGREKDNKQLEQINAI